MDVEYLSALKYYRKKFFINVHMHCSNKKNVLYPDFCLLVFVITNTSYATLFPFFDSFCEEACGSFFEELLFLRGVGYTRHIRLKNLPFFFVLQ